MFFFFILHAGWYKFKIVEEKNTRFISPVLVVFNIKKLYSYIQSYMGNFKFGKTESQKDLYST